MAMMDRAPTPTSQDSTVPIGTAVSRLQAEFPDVTRSSLRFLEREGLVSPVRTPGGHRLYRESDIERVARIKRWQQQHLSLDDIRDLLEQADRMPDLPELAKAFVEEGKQGRFAAAARMVINADDFGVPMIRIFNEVLTPAMIQVGKLWETGDVLVAQEKQFSEAATEVVIELSRRHLPEDPHGTPLVAACVRGTRHQLGIRMLVGILRSEGYRVHYLGPDVAPEFLLQAVQMHDPKGILLSADLPERLPDVADAVRVLGDHVGADALPPVIVGGRGVAASIDDIRKQGLIPMAGGSIPDEIAAIMAVVPPDGE